MNFTYFIDLSITTITLKNDFWLFHLRCWWNSRCLFHYEWAWLSNKWSREYRLRTLNYIWRCLHKRASITLTIWFIFKIHRCFIFVFCLCLIIIAHCEISILLIITIIITIVVIHNLLHIRMSHRGICWINILKIRSRRLVNGERCSRSSCTLTRPILAISLIFLIGLVLAWFPRLSNA